MNPRSIAAAGPSIPSALRAAQTTAGSAAADVSGVPPPPAWRLLLEARASWEFAALLAAAPWLARGARGDGHPVIVYPGLGASDLSTSPLRRFLRARGHSPVGWGDGLNRGPRDGVLDRCRERLDAVVRRRGPVSLVGWSLGGVYARELAKEQPAGVRCVVTLGSPFAGPPRATRAWRLYEWASGLSAHDDPRLATLGAPPPVPTTSIYSRSDAVVAWRCSVNAAAPRVENVEVAGASHVGLGVNPLALYVVADRLAQDPARWQRFVVDGARRWFYRADPGVAGAA
jgi:pimeloyl-ACP methyl ester carboxylesterase